MLLTALGGKILQMRKKIVKKGGVLFPCTCGIVVIQHLKGSRVRENC